MLWYFCHKAAAWNNGSTKLESVDLLNNSSGEITSAERQSKWCKFKWKVNENMQGRMCRQPVKQTNTQSINQPTKQTNKHVYRDVASASADSLLCGPLHGYQEEHFLRSTYPCGPKPGSQTTSEINVQNDITLKGGIANLERSHRLPHVFNNFHKFPQTKFRPLHV